MTAPLGPSATPTSCRPMFIDLGARPVAIITRAQGSDSSVPDASCWYGWRQGGFLAAQVLAAGQHGGVPALGHPSSESNNDAQG